MLKNGEINSGTELALLLIETFIKTNTLVEKNSIDILLEISQIINMIIIQEKNHFVKLQLSIIIN